MINTNTWLPIFSGFYHTIWDADDDYLEYDLKEQCEERGYSEITIQKIFDFLWNSDTYRGARNEYCYDTTKHLTTLVEKMLKELGMIHKIIYQEIVSPKQYNYMNDGINVQVQFKRSHKRKLKKYLKDNMDMWKLYLEERYTSRDGFWSHHANYPESEEWQIDAVVQHEHRVGSLLNFILLNEHEKNLADGHALEKSLEYELYSEVQENVCSLTVEFDPLLYELVENHLDKTGMPTNLTELVYDRLVMETSGSAETK